ncbi:MAG: dTDP-4-dehydrorhamnose reductase [Bacteroidales bacterium]|nr:dTDP-4-dehydrorhamnose reductase [Bacteroidales bacterium]
MNIIVTGAGGQLGTALRRVASSDAADRYIFTDVAELDITSREAVFSAVRREKADAIVNCAAYTNVEKAEDDYEAASLLNATAPGILAEAMQASGGLLVHISTDYVFGKDSFNTPCTEDRPCAPSGVYGLTKLRGEQAVQASGCRHLIIRTSWLYSEYGNNFVKTMLRLSAEKPSLNVVFDQVGTPTYALDLARAIHTVIHGRLYEGHEGIYHYSGEGVCSWYDFAEAIASMSGHTGCEIHPCRSAEYPSKVERPAYSVLDKTKFKKTFGIPVRYWRDSLSECLSNMTEI